LISSYREYLELQNYSTMTESEKLAIRNLEMERHGPYVRYCSTSNSHKATVVIRPRVREAMK
jgi:hypothetical protein